MCQGGCGIFAARGSLGSSAPRASDAMRAPAAHRLNCLAPTCPSAPPASAPNLKPPGVPRPRTALRQRVFRRRSGCPGQRGGAGAARAAPRAGGHLEEGDPPRPRRARRRPCLLLLRPRPHMCYQIVCSALAVGRGPWDAGPRPTAASLASPCCTSHPPPYPPPRPTRCQDHAASDDMSPILEIMRFNALLRTAVKCASLGRAPAPAEAAA
jgi:hypothetical protein